MPTIRELIAEARRVGQDALGIANDPEAVALVGTQADSRGRRPSKAELLEAFREEHEHWSSAATAERTLDAAVEKIVATLRNKGNMTLVGFGTFKVVHRKVRGGRGPQTRAEIKFQPDAELKKALKSP